MRTRAEAKRTLRGFDTPKASREANPALSVIFQRALQELMSVQRGGVFFASIHPAALLLPYFPIFAVSRV